MAVHDHWKNLDYDEGHHLANRVWLRKLFAEYEPNRHGGVVYLVQGEKTRLIKIGHTIKIENRMKHIQAHSPDRIIKRFWLYGDKKLEKSLHGYLSHYRRHGEWFSEQVLADLEPYLHLFNHDVLPKGAKDDLPEPIPPEVMFKDDSWCRTGFAA